MPPPRPVIRGAFYLITRRTTQRTFLMRPDAETNNAFTYCLAEAAARFDITVLMSTAMSNHHHTLIYDRHGNYPEFIEHLHKMLARCLNSLRGRWENFWASGQCSVVRLLDVADVIRKLIYVAANPVQDHLVERVHHWPGVNTLRALRLGIALPARRPAHFFRPDGPMPAVAMLRVSIPPELGDAETIIAAVVEGVAAVEARVAAERHQSGSRIVGRSAILRQSWRASPESFEQRRGMNPTFAAVDTATRLEHIRARREFERAYRAAREMWLEGLSCEFPDGTYWLKRFANVASISRPDKPPTASGAQLAS